MEMMKRLGTINHYHPTHIIHIRTTMRLLDLCVSSPGAEKDLSTQDLQLVLQRGKVLLKTLYLLLGEHTRPFVRYSNILEEVNLRAKKRQTTEENIISNA